MPADPSPRSYLLLEASYRQLFDVRPNVAILPWGATQAHNYHLPHGTDVIEATTLSERAAALAVQRGAKPLVLPTIPFGNNAQQQDQVATVHLSTGTAAALLHDIVTSLMRQGIDRLLILNSHGGNEFKPLVRDLMLHHDMLVVVVNFWQLRPEERQRIFEQPGDHADEMETSLMMHLRPELVVLAQAGPGRGVPWALKSLAQNGVWTPRPWSHVHPDTGSGDPSRGTALKGAEYFGIVTAAIADIVVELSAAEKGNIPYI